jgi:hypothetical protein
VATLFVVAGLLAATSGLGVRADESDPPLAARLLAEPYESTGVRVEIEGFGNMRGLATDSVSVYALDASGNIMVVPLSSVDMTPGGSVTVAGTMQTVGWGVDGAPSAPNLSRLSLSYSAGCLFITNDSNTLGQIRLYCIDVSDFSVTEVAVPGDKPLPVGNYYVESSLIDFPDGRIGKVSRYEAADGGGYESVLRTYTVSGTGADATISWSEDYVMSDPFKFDEDEHGIATDGTYLYRIQYKTNNPNTKVWQLASGSVGEPVYAGNYTEPFGPSGNVHFLSHNHEADYYLVGHWDDRNFFITAAADPGPGPGNALAPEFAAVNPTADGYTVQITNYDAAFSWSASATAGTASIDGSGLLTVKGLGSSESSTASVTATRTGFPDGSGDITGNSSEAPPTTTSTSTSTSTTTSSSTTTSTSTTTTSTVPAPTTSEPLPTTTVPSDAVPVPVRMPDGALPGPAAGEAILLVDRKPAPVTVTPNTTGDALEVSGDGFTMTIAGTGADGQPLPLSADGAIRLEPGRFARVQGSGFAPGTPVDVWLFSDPRYLGRITVGGDGIFDGQVPVPTDVELGRHTLQANGTTADGAQRSISLGVVVEADAQTAPAGAAAPTELAFTGAASPWLTVLGLLFLLLGVGVVAAPSAGSLLLRYLRSASRQQ